MALDVFLKHHFLFAYRYIHDSRKILLQVNQITSFIILCKALFKQVNVFVLKKENFKWKKRNIILQIKTIIL